jgi:hypothetical protein
MENRVDKSNFNIKLTGELQEIDASTFIDAIGNLLVGFYQINEELRPHKGLQINIKEIKPAGSIGIFFTIKEAVISTLPILQNLAEKDITTLAALLSIIVSVLTIRKFLKGERPKETKSEENQITITNAQGNTMVFDLRAYKIYSENQAVDTSFGKAFDVLKEDESVKGFEIYKDNGDKLFEVIRDDFNFLSKPSVTLETDTKYKVEEVILKIFKIVFEKGYKWQFFYQGIKISADIKDDVFFQSIDNGSSFSKGDTLIVDLQITQVYDKSVETYINKDYTIIRVKKHIPRISQDSLLST